MKKNLMALLLIAMMTHFNGVVSSVDGDADLYDSYGNVSFDSRNPLGLSDDEFDQENTELFETDLIGAFRSALLKNKISIVVGLIKGQPALVNHEFILEGEMKINPLGIAIKNGNYNLVKVLLENGANSTMEVDGFTPLDYAYEYRDRQMTYASGVDIFNADGSINQQKERDIKASGNIEDAIKIEAVNKAFNILDILFRYIKKQHQGISTLSGTSKKINPLSPIGKKSGRKIISVGSTSPSNYGVQYDEKSDHQTSDNFTQNPNLTSCAELDPTDQIIAYQTALSDNNLTQVKLFIEQQPDLVNYQFAGGSEIVNSGTPHFQDVTIQEILTPLGIAIQIGSVDLVTLLLEHGADPNLKSNFMSPMQIAKEYENDQDIMNNQENVEKAYKILRLLDEAGSTDSPIIEID